MRILQISSAKNFGGGEKHLVDLASGLRRARTRSFFSRAGRFAGFGKVGKLSGGKYFAGENQKFVGYFGGCQNRKIYQGK